jgi:hypothetical protein
MLERHKKVEGLNFHVSNLTHLDLGCKHEEQNQPCLQVISAYLACNFKQPRRAVLVTAKSQKSIHNESLYEYTYKQCYNPHSTPLSSKVQAWQTLYFSQE